MRKNLLINLILAITVIGLWWLLAYQPTPARKLSESVDTPVSFIHIQRPDKADIQLRRTESSQWRLTRPIDARAGQNRVQLLLNLLEQPLTASIQSPEDIARFGFGNRYVRLQYGKLTIGIGEREPLSGQRYLLYDQQVYLTDDRIMPLLSAGIASFVDHRPLPPAGSITDITLPKRHQQQLLSEQQQLSTSSHAATIRGWQQASATRTRMNPLEQSTAGRPMSVTYEDGSVEHFRLQFDNQLIVTTADGALDYIFPAAMLSVLIPATE